MRAGNIQEGETAMTELYSANPVMFKNNPIGFIITLLVIPVAGIGIIILLSWHLQNRASKLVLTDQIILYEKGLMSKERSEFNISQVRTVKVRQSFFNRIFGTGTIEIYTAGDEPEFIAEGMPDPNKVRELIKQYAS